MADLKTKYMGLELKNPIIAGASNLVTDIGNLRRIEEAGAAAVVYKTLFEEQVHLENLEYHESRTEYQERNAEMITLFPGSKSDSDKPAAYLMNLRKAKEAVRIPLFGSLNAVYDESWIEYAREIEKTGVDGIELNFYTLPEKTETDVESIEEKQVAILKNVKSAVRIPVAVKLSPYYTNPLRVISDIDKAGSDGIVLFNRLFQPDIDIEGEKHHYPYNLSTPADHRLPLRFAGLLYGSISAPVCASSGIFSGHDLIKMILAGASAVQVVSTLYKNGIEVIGKMIAELDDWMNRKGYSSIDSFRGRLSGRNTKSDLPYRRTQYIDFMMSTTEILRRHREMI